MGWQHDLQQYAQDNLWSNPFFWIIVVLVAGVCGYALWQSAGS